MEPHFVTLMYGVISPDGRFRYSNAGQNPPALLTAGGIRFLSAGGPMLGLFDDPAFPEETVWLQPGDRVAVFSDGLTEAINECGEEYSEDRLLQSLQQHIADAPDALLESMLESVRRFSGQAPQRDDVTAVVMRFR
jgi:sigma-B regulation protein RsbU (phosphoserine phosphatase)